MWESAKVGQVYKPIECWALSIFSSAMCSSRVIVIALFPSSVNIFSSVTSQSIVMKLHRKHPLNVLTRIPSNCLDPCRLKKKFSQICWPIFKQFCRNVPWLTLYQIPSSHVDWSKNMAARGWGLFALYGYSGNLKKILLKKHFSFDVWAISPFKSRLL